MAFIESLEQTISQWRNQEKQDEWLFADFMKNEINVLTPSEAFLLINEIIPILINVNNSDIWTELFALVISLARKSDTTEIPTVLFANWNIIKNIAFNIGEYSIIKFNELAKYYRINY